jgi:replicative DNA helicase
MSKETRIEKLPPQNIEAEEAVLGALLIDSDAIIRVSTVVQPDDFYREKNGWIYSATLALHERHEPIDFLTLCDELERKGQLEELGGPAYLTGLINAVPTSVHVEHYATIVQRAAVRRRLIQAAGQIAALAYKEEDDLDEVVDRAEQVVFSVSSARLSRSVVPLRSAVSDYYDRVEYLNKHKGQMIGLPTGFAKLDELLGGMQRSDMLVLAARPSMGKTSLALNISHTAEAKINSQHLRRGEIADDEWGRFMKATACLSELPFFIDDTPAISVLEMRTKARRLHAEVGLDLIVVDYLQLMRAEGRHENRQQEVSAISRRIKALARELNIPILAVSQLSRGVEARTDKRPVLSDLRESGSIEQDADVVLFIYRDEVYDENTERRGIADILIAKHRHGPVGSVPLLFCKATASFVDAELRQVRVDSV